MPFRLPQNFTDLPVWHGDPTREKLAEYIAWLRRELYVALAAFEQTPVVKPQADPKPADGQ